MRRLSIAVLALAVQGCELFCSDEAKHAVVVQVWDGWTGDRLDATPWGVLTDGSYREEMTVALRAGRHVLTGGTERPGTYDVAVYARGYGFERIEDVEVGYDGCHVETAEFSGPMSPGCTLIAKHSVIVDVWDERTGAAIANATGTMTEGSFREEMSGGHTLYGGLERPGTYDVEVRAPGYIPWLKKGVKVEDDGCHVVTAELDAGMVRLTPP